MVGCEGRKWDYIMIAECVRIVESLREVDNITQVSYSDVLKVQSYMEFYFDTMIRYVWSVMLWVYVECIYAELSKEE